MLNWNHFYIHIYWAVYLIGGIFTFFSDASFIYECYSTKLQGYLLLPFHNHNSCESSKFGEKKLMKEKCIKRIKFNILQLQFELKTRNYDLNISINRNYQLSRDNDCILLENCFIKSLQ